MHPYLEQAVVVLSYVGTILYYASFAILVVVRVLWHLLLWLLTPVIWIAHLLARPAIVLGDSIVLIFNAFLDFLRSFETLYEYLGIAVLVGAMAGLSLYGVTFVLNSVLGLYSANKDPAAVRSVAEYRAQRKRRREPRGTTSSSYDVSASSSVTLVNGSAYSKWQDRGLLSPNTILEEEDSGS